MVVEFSIFPLGGRGTGMGRPLAKLLRLVDASGLDYRLGSMCTVVEGPWEKVIPLIERCHKEMLKKHPRVITSIKIDDRKGARGRIRGKVESVARHAGGHLRT